MAEVMMNVETIDELKEKVLEEIRKREGEYDVNVQKTAKQNRIVTAVCLKPKNGNAGPAVYLEDLMEVISEGTDEKAAIKAFVDTLEHSLLKADVDLEFIHDFEKVTEKLSYYLVNKDRNAKLLADVVHADTNYDDLALVPIIHVANEEIGVGVITITNKLASVWDVDDTEIIRRAKHKAPVNDPFEIMDFPPMPGFEFMPMPFEIITTEGNMKGARVLEYPEFFSYMDKNYPDGVYIIPSSIHEVLLMRSAGMFESELEMINTLQLIETVNSEVLSEADFLSDKLYTYKDGVVHTYDKADF